MRYPAPIPAENNATEAKVSQNLCDLFRRTTTCIAQEIRSGATPQRPINMPMPISANGTATTKRPMRYRLQPLSSASVCMIPRDEKDCSGQKRAVKRSHWNKEHEKAVVPIVILRHVAAEGKEQKQYAEVGSKDYLNRCNHV